MSNVAFFMPKAAADWLAYGERGLSSDQMFETFTGLPCNSGLFRDVPHHPHDPSDLRRCVELLRYVPEFRDRLPKMREVSPTWSRLVDRWDELTALLEQEMSDNVRNRGMAPKTYDLMKEILNGQS